MNSHDDHLRPKRRVRYKGTHPKKFEQKYKELNPELYAHDVEKILKRGNTPAGSHRPICVDEILKVLRPKAGDLAIDATLGYGGHTSEILERLRPGGRLIGIEQDPAERVKTETRLRDKGFDLQTFVVAPINFKSTLDYLKQKKIGKVDLLLADLGVSSMQLDDPARGFSFKVEAPLDLRMNPSIGQPASVLLAQMSESELANLLLECADEMRAHVIAKSIKKAKPRSTVQLADSIRAAMAGFSARVRKEEGDLPIRRAFQALRILANDEFGALEQLLYDLPQILKPGGRVAILSFHSGEDRRVKKSFQAHGRSGVYSAVAPEFIRPSFEEQRANPRSKSAKLRWAVMS